MAVSNAWIDALLDLFFTNSAWANVGDASGLQGSATAGNFWIALHSSDPGVSGNQSTNEISYGGYARQAIARSGSGWTRTGQSVSPVATVAFPQATSGTATAAYASIGSDSTGTGHLWWSMPLTPNISIAAGVIPECTTASTNSIS
jgi:hypothetical protein